MLSLTLQIATSTFTKKKKKHTKKTHTKHVKHEFNVREDSTQICTQYQFCPSVM